MVFTRVTQAILLIGAIATSSAAVADDDWQVKTSPHSVAETVTRLTAAIEDAGAKVAAVIDHAAAAEEVDLELAPTTVVIFGNPKIGTPLMQENQKIGLDLPLRILVWQDGDETRVGYIEAEDLAERYDIDDDSKAVKMIENALNNLSDAAVAD